MHNPPVFAHQADFSTRPQHTLIRIKCGSDTFELMQFGIAPMPPARMNRAACCAPPPCWGKQKMMDEKLP
jgi:hypothetical protein